MQYQSGFPVILSLTTLLTLSIMSGEIIVSLVSSSLLTPKVKDKIHSLSASSIIPFCDNLLLTSNKRSEHFFGTTNSCSGILGSASISITVLKDFIATSNILSSGSLVVILCKSNPGSFKG